MSDRTRLTATALLLAQAAWAAAGFVFPSLPGWTMFAKAEKARARIISADGVAMDLYGLIPRDVYLIDKSGARAVAAWQCASRPDQGPWTLEWADGGGWEKPCPSK